MILQTRISSPPLHHQKVCVSATQLPHSCSFLISGSLRFSQKKLSFQAIVKCYGEPALKNSGTGNGVNDTTFLNLQNGQKHDETRKNYITAQFAGNYLKEYSQAQVKHAAEMSEDVSKGSTGNKTFTSTHFDESLKNLLAILEDLNVKKPLVVLFSFLFGQALWLISAQLANASEITTYLLSYLRLEIGELFELGIQLSYLLLLLGLLGAGTFFVIRQVLVRRELDLSAKELQEQVRSGDASATELFELGAVMLRRKIYPAATRYLLQAIEKWDGDDQDIAQVYNALGVCYVRDGKLEKGINQFETAVKIQPGYVTAWNNLGDAYEKKKEYKSALKAFEEVVLFDPNNKAARPRRDALKDRVEMYKGVPVKSKDR